ncbi:ubiquinone anaerobic biosynthesis accessory factor UbiT [sulfur-oxidizing endosymbiont of Gigantopelta aegis]|uniref:ubiquinone anaerobic biosynthesis accessory factor UbiT n=1 Tax=sulfur-oxidizing endosymbiont of Gigantopelta aegis TaxID=2794934 RepID=UPI0018DBF40B|nr:SCP2 sterol-binding domain-containing protein [sulfur-oxidizing endosymbiont of Gigantopelta aegis]
MKNTTPTPPRPDALFSKMSHRFARQLTTTLPSIVKHLPEPPFFIQKKIGESILQSLLAEPVEMGDFDCLEDRWLHIHINDADLNFFLSFKDEHLILGEDIAQADVIFSGNVKEFVLLASRKEDPDTLFFQRRLTIEGDTELGLEIKNTIDGIDFEQWPTWLNRIIQNISRFISDDESKLQAMTSSQPH